MTAFIRVPDAATVVRFFGDAAYFIGKRFGIPLAFMVGEGMHLAAGLLEPSNHTVTITYGEEAKERAA